MTAHIASLNTLQANVVAEVGHTVRAIAGGELGAAGQALQRLLSQLDADCREVRADVDMVFEREGQGW